jgi:hypothetical protein
MLEIFGGPDRDRTDDLFHAMEARSQLRHRPTLVGDNFPIFAVAGRFVKLRIGFTSRQAVLTGDIMG